MLLRRRCPHGAGRFRKQVPRFGRGFLAAFFALMASGGAFAQTGTALWTGAAGDGAWSDSGNWSGSHPGPSVAVLFLTNGAATASAASNNVVTSSVTVASLTYNNTNAYSGPSIYQNTYINAGATLLVSNSLDSNALFVGSGQSLPNAITSASISGGGAFQVVATNGSVNIRQGGSQNYAGMASLDLSGLGSCSIQSRQVLVAGDGSNANPTNDRPSGLLKLARFTSLVLNGPSYPPSLTVGFNIGNGSGGGASLILGQTNLIYSDAGMGVGLARIQGSVQFGGLANSSAVFRNTAGTGPQDRWLIGDAVNTGYSGDLDSGTVNFSGGTVDARVAQVVVGRSINDTQGNTNSAALGVLTFNAGTINADTLIMGYQVSAYGSKAAGTVNVDGTGQLQVNNSIELGRFEPAVASNGVSSAVLNIGAVSGGGSVTVGGGITTVTSAGSSNDSEILVANGGSLSVQGGIGPLLRFQLNSGSLALNLGSAPNPAAPVCVASNLTLVAPVSLAIAGTGLTNGQFPLFKYGSLLGGGFGAITGLSFSSQLGGYLSNNAANSSIDLVITQSQPVAPPPPPATPRLSGNPPVYADYDKILTEAQPRADGYTHVDTPGTIARLVAGNIKTYAYLCWMDKTDWDDLRLEFLPAAQAAGIHVWLYLTPPTENSPPAAYVPFADDYYSWMAQAAGLSVKYPCLQAVVMDDFDGNLGLFTPNYVSSITAGALAINPSLMFMVINYDLTKGWASPTNYVSPAFMSAYGPYCGAVIFPYMNWATNSYYGDAAYQMAQNSGIITGSLAQFLVNFPAGTPTAAGDSAGVTEILTNASGFPNSPYPFSFRVSGYPSTGTSGYHQLQLLVNSTVVWSQDISAAYGVQTVTTNLQAWLAGQTSATVTARVYDQRGVSSFRILSSWILPGGPWVKAESGGFTGYSTYYPATPTDTPMVIMIYDWQYGGGGDNTAAYVLNVNEIAQASVQAGQAAGIIQYQLDKSTTNALFPIVQQLYGQWAYHPRFTAIIPQAGGVILGGGGGGPNIGYTLTAADSPAAPLPWGTVASNTFDSNGYFLIMDATAAGHSNRFYRIAVP